MKEQYEKFVGGGSFFYSLPSMLVSKSLYIISHVTFFQRILKRLRIKRIGNKKCT